MERSLGHHGHLPALREHVDHLLWQGQDVSFLETIRLAIEAHKGRHVDEGADRDRVVGRF